MDSLSRQNYLIDAEQLNSIIDEPKLKLFDIRGARSDDEWSEPVEIAYEKYKQNHARNARFLDWKLHFLQPGFPIKLAPVCDQKNASKAFKSLGINSGDTVVIYDDFHHKYASRLWWAMRYWGHPDVRILNGGWQHWESQDYPCTTDVPNAVSGNFKPVEQASMRASVQDVEQITPNTFLVDARDVALFKGSREDARTGHIPGSLNLPFKELQNSDTGLFKSTPELYSLFDEHITRWPDSSIITTCSSGYAGATLLFALAKGGIDAPLFDGSFEEWKQDENRTVSNHYHR